jgi:hypothetical protein
MGQGHQFASGLAQDVGELRQHRVHTLGAQLLQAFFH